MAPHELQTIEKTMPSEVEQLDEIQSQVTAPHRMNIGPFLHFSRISDQRERQWRWYLTITTALCVLVTLGFVLYSQRSYHWYLWIFPTTPNKNRYKQARDHGWKSHAANKRYYDRNVVDRLKRAYDPVKGLVTVPRKSERCTLKTSPTERGGRPGNIFFRPHTNSCATGWKPPIKERAASNARKPSPNQASIPDACVQGSTQRRAQRITATKYERYELTYVHD